MTDLLLRLFVKHASDTSDPAVRAGYGRLAGVTGIVCNLLLFALKLLAGTISGSVSITADAVNNLSDASGSIVTLVGFKLASRPADDEHPYGHARMEYLSGLAVAVLILVIGVELVKSSVGKILHPEAVEFSALIVVILVCSILVKLWMAVFNRKLGRRIGSAALTAAAADSRNDVISTGAVLLACIVGQLTGLKIDGYVGKIMETLEKNDMKDDAIVFFTADHGGTGKGHGGISMKEMETPFVVCGKGIKQGHEIPESVMVFDCAPTIGHIFSIDQPQVWIGRPVMSVFE